MKNLLLSIVFIVYGCMAFGQKTTYELKTDINYYSDSINSGDAYIKERCVLDIYYPVNVKDFATVVWFHGGGLKAGNKEFPAALKEKGVCIVAVNYRLYPKVNAPKYIEDAAASVAWVFKNINSFGGDSNLIFVSGHSAGGYLTSMIGLDKRWLKPYGIDANQIAGLIPFSGQAITHFTVREERGIAGTQPVVDDLAPLFHVRPDAPPLLLITGDRELELLGRYEENAYLMRMMKVVGHKETKLYELNGYGHGMTEPAFPLLLNEVQRIVEKKKEEAK
ncbi:lipase [Labilibaculum manganireducens]|uniref:Lipase n=1 Tax=Labilibaculum manganireducens TaxID=1940525 RepID=A0A2N3IET9_9BACT|nr:alpha/beta hydrolase [Labilibaculum manganireducens]PKQ68816.1 lipase [Labilibaculum manganireducens]